MHTVVPPERTAWALIIAGGFVLIVPLLVGRVASRMECCGFFTPASLFCSKGKVLLRIGCSEERAVENRHSVIYLWMDIIVFFLSDDELCLFSYGAVLS